MTMEAPAIPSSRSAQLRWVLIDALTIAGRAVDHWKAQPGTFAVGLLFPVLVLLMFNYLFGGSIRVPGGGEYVNFLVPGLFTITMFFGLEATVIAMTTDASKGVTERFRALPMAQSAVVSGRAAADMLNAVAGLAVMLAAGLLVGWQFNEGIGNVAIAVALLLLLRLAVIWVGVYLGLRIEADGVTAVQILVWPIGFLSSVFVAPSTMPGWLGTIAEWNPISSTVTAVRELFGNPGVGGESWIVEHAELMAVIWPLAITAVFAPLSVRAYARLSR